MSEPTNAEIFLRRIDELTEQLAQAEEREKKAEKRLGFMLSPAVAEEGYDDCDHNRRYLKDREDSEGDTYDECQVCRAEKAEAERDEALAEVGMLKMGFEPAPTADAYEAVCKDRTKWQERAEKAEGDPRLHLMFCKTCKVWHDGEGPCPACDEVKRLRVIADTLPKTADGVPAMAGKSVFSVEVDGSIYANELVWWSFKGGHAALLMHSGYRNRLGVWIDQWKFASECYSTREAALAAKEASDA